MTPLNEVRSSHFRQASPLRKPQDPGQDSPAVQADNVEISAGKELRTKGTSTWKKALLGVAGMSSALVGTAAAAAPQQVALQQTLLQTQEKFPLQIVLIPNGTPRVDILRQTEERGDRTVERDYAMVGVDLGNGVFHDAHGNLSFVPALAFGWDGPVRDFKRVEVKIPAGFDQNVGRFFNTVHYNESPYTRNVYVEVGKEVTLTNREGKFTYERLPNGVQLRSKEGLRWRVTDQGDKLFIDGPADQDMTIERQGHSVRLQAPHQRNTVNEWGNKLEVDGTGRDYEMTREGDTTRIKGGFLNNYTITREGNMLKVDGPLATRIIDVNPQQKMERWEVTYGELTKKLEEAEPGYVQRHPLVMAVLEYAVQNPGLIGEENGDIDGVVQGGTAIATAGGALHSGVALTTGAKALSLAENARALGASAMAAKAAAQTAAQAGNLSRAAALGAEAQQLAGQARSLGDQAMRLGEGAKNAAQVAKIMNGVAGALEIVDGGMDIHKGSSDKSIVKGAMAITEAVKDQLQTQQTGPDLERTMEDYSKIMSILHRLEGQANKQIRVGGLKIGCGGLLLISALAGGGVLPLALGAVGTACTIGTAAYEHWDTIEAFFSGKPIEEDPTLRELFPPAAQNELRIKMD